MIRFKKDGNKIQNDRVEYVNMDQKRIKNQRFYVSFTAFLRRVVTRTTLYQGEDFSGKMYSISNEALYTYKMYGQIE